MKKLDLTQQLNDIFRAYTDELNEEITKAAEEVATETAEKIKAASPKRRPAYFKGWGKKKLKVRGYVVYNKTYPGLAHLLEYGHATRSGGRVPAQVHIRPAEEEGIKKFEEVLRRNIEKI